MITNETQCFAEPGAHSIIDTVDADGRGHFSRETLDEVRKRYPAAEMTTVGAHCEAKAKRQDEPVTWQETTAERYCSARDVLPPAFQVSGAFMLGEPFDHHARTGEPRFDAYRRIEGRYYVSSRPMTVREFKRHLQ